MLTVLVYAMTTFVSTETTYLYYLAWKLGVHQTKIVCAHVGFHVTFLSLSYQFFDMVTLLLGDLV